MNLQGLRYFKRAAELNSISKTAAEYHVVQSAVSTRIKDIETELGVKLFDRTSGSITLNEKGWIVYNYASQILELVKDSVQELAEANGKSSRPLTIASETVPLLLPHLIKDFQKTYPEVKLKVIQYRKDFEMQDMECDILITFSGNPVQEETAVTVYEEAILPAVAKNHPLAGKKIVSIDELNQQSFIARSEQSELQMLMYEQLPPKLLYPRVSVTCDYPPIINDLLSKGTDVAFLPKLTWMYYDNPDIVLLEMEGIQLKRYINLMWRKGAYVSAPMRLFLDHARVFFSHLK